MAAQQSAPGANINHTVNIGLAAAIAIGSPQMVERYDINGDERLDQRERGRAIDSVTSEEGNAQAPGGKMFRSGKGEEMANSAGQGDVYFAEMEAEEGRLRAATRRGRGQGRTGPGRPFGRAGRTAGPGERRRERPMPLRELIAPMPARKALTPNAAFRRRSLKA